MCIHIYIYIYIYTYNGAGGGEVGRGGLVGRRCCQPPRAPSDRQVVHRVSDNHFNNLRFKTSQHINDLSATHVAISSVSS